MHMSGAFSTAQLTVASLGVDFPAEVTEEMAVQVVNEYTLDETELSARREAEWRNAVDAQLEAAGLCVSLIQCCVRL